MKDKWFEAGKFVLSVVAATCMLGIAIDVVTANVAVEYFSLFHPHVVDSDSPWALAVVWGVIASWWFGLISGVLVWWSNLRRKVPLARNVVMPMVVRAMVAIWLIMMGILVVTYMVVGFIGPASKPPTFESDRRLVAVAAAHAGEYVLGAIVTIVVMRRVARYRDTG